MLQEGKSQEDMQRYAFSLVHASQIQGELKNSDTHVRVPSTPPRNRVCLRASLFCMPTAKLRSGASPKIAPHRRRWECAYWLYIHGRFSTSSPLCRHRLDCTRCPQSLHFRWGRALEWYNKGGDRRGDLPHRHRQHSQRRIAVDDH